MDILLQFIQYGVELESLCSQQITVSIDSAGLQITILAARSGLSVMLVK